MKLKIGQKLHAIREERKLSQQEIADILSLTPSSYARIERGETCINLDDLPRFASLLNIPLQDLLPDILSMQTHNTNSSQSGIIMGNIYNNYYDDKDKHIKELNERIKNLENLLNEFKKAQK